MTATQTMQDYLSEASDVTLLAMLPDTEQEYYRCEFVDELDGADLYECVFSVVDGEITDSAHARFRDRWRSFLERKNLRVTRRAQLEQAYQDKYGI